MCEGCVCVVHFYGFRCGWHALISVKWACCQSLYILSLVLVRRSLHGCMASGS